MKISSKLLNQCFKTSYGYINNCNIECEDLAILAIFQMHFRKVINDDSLNANIRKYHNKTLVRAVKTYHCTINDRWYSDTSTFEAIIDAWNDTYSTVDFKVEDMLFYLNKLLNKNKNYCIDHLLFTYINPILETINENNSIELYNSFEIGNPLKTYEQMDRNDELSYGYCCRDCDGCLREYKSYRYKEYLGYNLQKKLRELVNLELNSLKTPSSHKNINNKTRAK